MNNKIFSLIMALLLIAANTRAQKQRTYFPVGTYHINNSTIHGISGGLITIPGKKSNTNGIKIEAIGAGLLLALAPQSPIATNASEYKAVMQEKPDGYINGIVLSGLGTFCRCNTNGISLGLAGQLNRTFRGLSSSAMFNYAEKHAGIQTAIIFSAAYEMRGIQISSQNYAQVSGGIQAGIFNSSSAHSGLQIGIYNKAKYQKGLQLGIWNVNQKRKTPFINWNL